MKIQGARIFAGGVDAKSFGYSKYAIDTFTPTSDFYSTYSNYPINHSLGVVPKIAFLFPSDNITWNDTGQLVFATLKDTFSQLMSSSDGLTVRYVSSWTGADPPTSSVVNYGTTNAGIISAGITYTLITMA